MIASHYAEPVGRRLAAAATVRYGPSADSDPVETVEPGEAFCMLDDSLGWAWGYVGADRRVGYLPSETLAKD